MIEDLVKFVEETVRLEHESTPNKPIYLVGDSFGGCLALAVAACNPKIDIVVILVNPGECPLLLLFKFSFSTELLCMDFFGNILIILTFTSFYLATSFDRSHLLPLLPILEALPDGLYNLVPYFLSSVMSM